MDMESGKSKGFAVRSIQVFMARKHFMASGFRDSHTVDTQTDIFIVLSSLLL